MSGGHFEHIHTDICNRIFDWQLNVTADFTSKTQRRSALKARRLNPLEDVELSEMLYDLCCILKAYDWYVSGDTSIENYTQAKDYFKNKWFGKSQKERLELQCEKALDQLRVDMYQMVKGVEKDD